MGAHKKMFELFITRVCFKILLRRFINSFQFNLDV